VSGQLHAPAALPSGKSLWYLFYRRLGGPQSRSGRYGEEKIFDPTGTRTPTPLVVQPVASRYTDWAIPAPHELIGPLEISLWQHGHKSTSSIAESPSSSPCQLTRNLLPELVLSCSLDWLRGISVIGHHDHCPSTSLSFMCWWLEKCCLWTHGGHTRELDLSHSRCCHTHKWPWHCSLLYTLQCEMRKNVYQSGK
jgi:hypothetical protein